MWPVSGQVSLHGTQLLISVLSHLTSSRAQHLLHSFTCENCALLSLISDLELFIGIYAVRDVLRGILQFRPAAIAGCMCGQLWCPLASQSPSKICGCLTEGIHIYGCAFVTPKQVVVD
jgi:hypothetical protein